MGEPVALIRAACAPSRYPEGVRYPSHEARRRPGTPLGILAVVLAFSGFAAHGQEAPAQGGEPEADEPLTPPSPLPRRSVDGLRGMVTHSVLEFAGHGRPHSLAAVFVFPDRARWRIEPRGGDEAARRMRFRYGAHTFGIEPGQTASHALRDAQAVQCLLQMELRRAATLWPHGFPWRGEGRLRTAVVEGAGQLVALLDPAGERPVELSSLRADGRTLESLREIRWRDPDADGRRWPASWDLLVEGRTVWSETITSVDTATRYLDAYFLPADRRARSSATDARRVLSVDMPRRVQRRFPLPQPTWDAAAKRGVSLADEWRATDGAAPLDGGTTVELDGRGRPVAVLLQLSDPLAEVPEGWSVRPGCPGVATRVDGLARIDGALLRRLGEHAPPGAERDAPLLRMSRGAQPPLEVRVFLPLRPGDE